MAFWKKLGKGLVKVGKYAAPIALGMIPGVGIPLAMAAGGALNAADTKMSGGSWKDALISGSIGAASGYGGGALGKAAGGAMGIGKSVTANAAARGVAGAAAKEGAKRLGTAGIAKGLGYGLSGLQAVEGIRGGINELRNEGNEMRSPIGPSGGAVSRAPSSDPTRQPGASGFGMTRGGGSFGRNRDDMGRRMSPFQQQSDIISMGGTSPLGQMINQGRRDTLRSQQDMRMPVAPTEAVYSPAEEGEEPELLTPASAGRPGIYPQLSRGGGFGRRGRKSA